MTVHYPDHAPRADDPHYKDFEAYRRRTEATATCAWADQAGTAAHCGGGLELHHGLEFALLNAVDTEALRHAHPDAVDAGAWIESAGNLRWLCMRHHRGAGSGIHDVNAALYESSPFLVSGTISS